MSLDARNYRLTYADVISRMTLSVLLCYKLLALGSHKHIHYSCTSLLHVSSTTELEHAGPKCLQALCTLGDWVRRTPRTQNIAQRVPIAQTTWQWQAGIVKLLLRVGSLHWFLCSFLFEPHCSSPCPFRLLQRLLWYSLSPKKSHMILLSVHCVCVCTIIITTSKSNSIVLEGYYIILLYSNSNNTVWSNLISRW